jgi:hypothetical protein
LEQTCSSVWQGPEERASPNVNDSSDEVWGSAVEGFMQQFAAGRFRTQSLFLLAQLNGIAAFNTWMRTGSAPVVIMPNAVRRRLQAPSSKEAVAEDAAIAACGTTQRAVSTTADKSLAGKRAVLRRVRWLDRGVHWPSKGSWDSKGEAALTRERPTLEEASPTAAIAAMNVHVEDWALDVADAAAVGITASCHALEVELAISPAHLMALHTGSHPDLSMGACEAVRLGAAVMGFASKAARARLAACADASAVTRLHGAVGVAWLQALRDAADSARSSHGPAPTPHLQAQNTSVRQWCRQGACHCVPTAKGEEQSPAGLAHSLLGWPWGGVPAGIQKRVFELFDKAAAAAENPRTRPHTRLGLQEGDAAVLGESSAKAAAAVRAAARGAAVAVNSRVDKLLLEAGIQDVLDAAAASGRV